MTSLVPIDNVKFDPSTQETLFNVEIQDSSNVHLGNQVQYYGPIKVQQKVTGLPEELATRPEVGEGLAKFGLAAATSTVDPLFPQSVTIFVPESNKCKIFWWLILLVGALLSALLSILFFIFLASPKSEETKVPTEVVYNPFLPSSDYNVTLSGKLNILERREWFAQPKNHSQDVFKVKYVLITETGGDKCTTNAKCKLQILLAQQYDLKHNLEDIAPNFLLGGDGYAYEGRKWNTHHQCTLNQYFDRQSICISFVGEFIKQKPVNNQLLAARQLIDQGILLEKLDQNYTVYGAHQINSMSDKPSKLLFEIIRTWPNWSNIVKLDD